MRLPTRLLEWMRGLTAPPARRLARPLDRQRALTVVALLLAALGCLAPATALAHPLLDEGTRKYDEADFQGAIAAFTRAEQATDLTRDDLVQLYLRRAMVHQAMGHAENVEADLFRLASLDRALALPREATPAIRAAYAQATLRATGTLRLDVAVRAIPSGLKLIVRVADDSAALVQALRIRARVPGGAWRRSDRASIEVPTTAGATVQYVAEGIGPGGALIVSAGTESAPLTATPGGAPTVDDATSARGLSDALETGHGAPDAGAGAQASDTGGVGAWPWLVGGGVLVAAGAVVAILLLTGSDPNQRIAAPTVTF